MTEKSPVKVLMTDDSAEDRELLIAALEPLALEVVQAGSGQEALELVRDREFAVILLDGKMPGMDGFEVASRIRSGGRGSTTPIIFVSGESQSHEQEFAGYESGAVDYLLKPVVPQILHAKVGAFAQLYRQNLELKEALANVRTLSALLPVCASCKRIRDDNGEWKTMEAYLQEYAGSQVSHGMCPDCMSRYYPGRGGG